MKRWTGLWQRLPRLRVTLVSPGHETNPLAEKIMEQLQRAMETAEAATEVAQSSNEALRDANEALCRAHALIAELQTRLNNIREAELVKAHDERLAAYFLASGRVAEA